MIALFKPKYKTPIPVIAPAVTPSRTVPNTFVVTEEHLDQAIKLRHKVGFSFNSCDDCLVATAMKSYGYKFDYGTVGYSLFLVEGKFHRLLNCSELIQDFIY